MAQLKRFGVMSVAKLYAILMAVFGFVVGLFVAILTFIAGIVNSAAFGFDSAALSFGFGLASIIIFPIIYAILGFVCGAIMAFLYNIVAGKIGGIEMDFE